MYETGSRNPKSDFWIAAAQKYGSTIDYPMGFSNAQKKPSESKKSSSELSEEAKKAAKDDDSTDKLRQRTVRAAIDMEKER